MSPGHAVKEVSRRSSGRQDDPHDCDVAIVGAGPVGLLTGALLASMGHHVIVLERHPGPYGMPRAGHIDHECLRILQGIGAHRAVVEDAPAPDWLYWRNAQGLELMKFPFANASISGYQSDFMMFQPVLDDALQQVLDRYPDRAQLCFGHDVISLREDGEGVALRVNRTDAGARAVGSSVNAKYVIAADGARSRIRGLLGITRSDAGFVERWFTIDCRKKKDIPSTVDGVWCDPRRPAYVGPLGRRHHRFELALLPSEKLEECDEARAWELLAERGISDADVEIYRRVVYTFEARMAERWNSDRVFLAGDSAHTMPPLMGQGLCSGMRDAANLAWKLDLVLTGRAHHVLLASYEAERRPHAQGWLDRSVAVKPIACELDPVRASERDARLLAGHFHLPPEPRLGPGLTDGDGAAGSPRRGGALFLQAQVTWGGRSGLFHDVFGVGFFVVSAEGDPRTVMSREALDVLEQLDARVLWFGDSSGTGEGHFEDVDGGYADFFRDIALSVVIVRPDFYVFGGSGEFGGVSALIQDLGVRLALTVDGVPRRGTTEPLKESDGNHDD